MIYLGSSGDFFALNTELRVDRLRDSIAAVDTVCVRPESKDFGSANAQTGYSV